MCTEKWSSYTTIYNTYTAQHYNTNITALTLGGGFLVHGEVVVALDVGVHDGDHLAAVAG